MAQQTINIGASPNDGTGTPLRTAFQYTNSNFSELYTAVGPSGNNIVVPGTATITGDLTVDTSTLKVDSANNRVGVLTASPAATLSVVGSAGTGNTVAGITGNTDSGLLSIGNDNSNGLAGSQTWTGSAQSYAAAISFGQVNTTGVREQTRTHATLFSTNIQSFGRADLVIATKGSLDNNDPTEKYRIASDGVATWSNVGGVAGTAMTLNATGLLVGTTNNFASSRLCVQGTAGTSTPDVTIGIPVNSSGNTNLAIGRSASTNGYIYLDAYKAAVGGTELALNSINGGSVLIGLSTVVAAGGCLQLKSGITFPATQVASADANTLDDYEEGTWTIGLTFGGASTGITTSTNTGRYTKVGRQVTVSGILALTNKGSSTGIAEITGLPFTIANGNEAYSAANVRFNFVSFADVPISIGAINSTKILLQEITNAGAVTDLTDADFTNTSQCIISFTYTV